MVTRERWRLSQFDKIRDTNLWLKEKCDDCHSLITSETQTYGYKRNGSTVTVWKIQRYKLMVTREMRHKLLVTREICRLSQFDKIRNTNLWLQEKCDDCHSLIKSETQAYGYFVVGFQKSRSSVIASQVELLLFPLLYLDIPLLHALLTLHHLRCPKSRYLIGCAAVGVCSLWGFFRFEHKLFLGIVPLLIN